MTPFELFPGLNDNKIWGNSDEVAWARLWHEEGRSRELRQVAKKVVQQQTWFGLLYSRYSCIGQSLGSKLAAMHPWQATSVA
jgi:hypothetical protein